MSVQGEFERHVGRCVDFLEASDVAGGYAWATRLLEARAIANDDLTAAAKRVLALADATPSIAAIEFEVSAEAESFRTLCDPMLDLSRVIAGVPAAPGA